jgi:chemotaxis protein MotA
MFAIIGIVTVLGCVIGGYLLEGGNLSLLFQPVELLIIGGAASGAFLISSPKKLLGMTIKALLGVFTGKGVTKESYLELLMAMNELFRKARREGLIAVESHVNRPEDSTIFTKYPGVLNNHHVLSFLCDNFKVYISTGMEPDSLDDLMEIDMETQHKETGMPAAAVAKVADGMPALGIVAAVLGVVLTMAKISEPPEVLGHSIGAALVGTFLGVLLSYGFVGPLASNMEHSANDHHIALNVIKTGLLSTVSGGSPAVALEFARRAIPPAERPGFEELEEALRGAKEG